MPALTLTGRRPTYGTGKATSYGAAAGSCTHPPCNTIIVWCSTVAYVRVGTTATTADLCLPANVIAEIPVDTKDGGPVTVSAIRAASDGVMYSIAAAE